MTERPKILPSVLSFAFTDIRGECARMKKAGLTFLHYDVMDGAFVPNISFGESIFRQIVPNDFRADVHLMVQNPLPHVLNFFAMGAEEVTVHYETIKDDFSTFLKAVEKVRQGRVLGLAVNPETPLETLKPLLSHFEKIMLMAVQPGASGQKFIPTTVERIATLHQYLQREKTQAVIQVDGGIDEITGPLCLKAGATLLVSGSYICQATDIAAAAAKILKTV